MYLIYLIYFINFLYFSSFITSFIYIWTLLKYINRKEIKNKCQKYGSQLRTKLNEKYICILKKYILTELLIVSDIIYGLSEGLMYNKKKIMIKHKL